MNVKQHIPELEQVRKYIRDSEMTYDDWARLCGVGYWKLAKFMTSANPTMRTYSTIRAAVDQHRSGKAA